MSVLTRAGEGVWALAVPSLRQQWQRLHVCLKRAALHCHLSPKGGMQKAKSEDQSWGILCCSPLLWRNTERGVMWSHLKVIRQTEVGERNDKETDEYSILINVLNRWVSCWMASFCNYSQTFRRGTVTRCLHPSSRSTRRLQLSAQCQCNPRG